MAIDQRLIAVVIIIAAVAIAAGLYFFFQPRAPAIRPPTALAECKTGDIANITCSGSVLSWRACSASFFISRNFDCAKLSEENRTGACQQSRCVQLDEQGRVTQVFTPSAETENVTATAAPGVGVTAGFLVVEPFSLGYCGDGYCDYKEDCGSCVQDCGCKSDEYCHPVQRFCKPKEACGDGICTVKEQQNQTCCSDCGCRAGLFCAVGLEQCRQPANITNATVDAAVASFVRIALNVSGLNYTLVSVFDDVYAGQSVKTAVLDCNKPGDRYVCRTLLVMLANGSTVEINAN